LYDTTSDFQYSYDSQSRRGKISYTFIIEGALFGGEDYIKDEVYDFGLFFDSDDLWLEDRNKVFIELE
jgi:hypothetical protein